ncbi:MAG TPA: hypothetical protein VMV94_13020, partial [Phycisphaerae bacterium]|nr:hypothetical protein [Phycisphaerae bacterium]
MNRRQNPPRRFFQISWFVIFLLLSALSCAVWFTPILTGVGGLEASNFELVSLNGFDPEDNARDKNDYAWAMEYFKPD